MFEQNSDCKYLSALNLFINYVYFSDRTLLITCFRWASKLSNAWGNTMKIIILIPCLRTAF